MLTLEPSIKTSDFISFPRPALPPNFSPSITWMMTVHVPCVTYAALYFSVTEHLCSPLQKYHPTLNPGQDQGQAHVQPLDLSHQSSASMTLYLMELHKLEEKHFSSKIGKWDKLLTNGLKWRNLSDLFIKIQKFIIRHKAQSLPFLLCVQRQQLLRESDGKFWFYG